MSERAYLFLLGVFILAALYLEIDAMIYGLLCLLVFEAITDIRLTTSLQRARNLVLDDGLAVVQKQSRFELEAIRVWRLCISVVLAVSFILVSEYSVDAIWFFPWFLGFAILGAGASGVCPMMLLLSWAGFR